MRPRPRVPTTVSRALNGYPEVKEATRLRVEAAARAVLEAPADDRYDAITHLIRTMTQ